VMLCSFYEADKGETEGHYLVVRKTDGSRVIELVL